MKPMQKPAAVFRHATAFFVAIAAFTGGALLVGVLLSHAALLAVDAASPDKGAPAAKAPAAKAPAAKAPAAKAPPASIAKGPALGAGGNAATGMKLFRQNNCSMCHPGGENNLNPLKPLKGPGFLKKYPTDELVCRQVRKGSVGTGMPAFPKSQITDQEMRDIIAYIRSLTPSNPAPSAQIKKASKKPA